MVRQKGPPKGWKNQPLVLDDAVAVAQILKRHPHVQGVELFGSIARVGSGNDIDLIILSDRAEGFFARAAGIVRITAELADLLDIALPLQLSPREEATVEVLGVDFRPLLMRARKCLPRTRSKSPLDLFVLVPDWKKHLDELERNMIPGTTFWKTIAKEAKPI